MPSLADIAALALSTPVLSTIEIHQIHNFLLLCRKLLPQIRDDNHNNLRYQAALVLSPEIQHLLSASLSLSLSDVLACWSALQHLVPTLDLHEASVSEEVFLDSGLRT